MCTALEQLLQLTCNPNCKTHTRSRHIGNWDVISTGIGKKRVTQSLENYLNTTRPDVIINIGLAGSLTSAFIRGTCLDISKVRTQSSSWHSLSLCSYHTQASLITVSTPIENSHDAHSLHTQTGAELVDMEAAYIADAAHMHTLPCRIIKIVSDFANADTRTHFKDTLATAHDAFYIACSRAQETLSHVCS